MKTNSWDEVFRILFARRRTNTKPTTRTDDHHVALVIEGGGMRGVAGGAMVTALEKAGLRDSFDSVHGSSAGAAAGAYFVAGQAELGTKIYYEDLNGPEFISPIRSLSGKPIMDTSYLVEYVMDQVKPIDYAKILSGDLPLHIIMTNIDTGDPLEVSEFGSKEKYRECLMATISLPFIAGPHRTIDGARVLDGGLVEQIALKSAVRAGATHILALQASPKGAGIRKTGTATLRAQAIFLQLFHGGQMGKIFLNRNRLINEEVRALRKGVVNETTVACAVQIPHNIPLVDRMTKDKDRLRLFAERIEEYMRRVIQGS
jgi:predicted patatin/cPLA2 family phospholipase